MSTRDLRVCIITGATGGIGKALSLKFGKGGFSLLLCGRSEEKLLSLKEELSEVKVECCFYDALIGNEKEIVERALDIFGKIDLLINAAGLGIYESFSSMEEKDLRQVFEVNFFSPFRLTKEALKYMVRGGTIINISSITARLPVPFMGGYGASKAALSSIMESLRAELVERDINVLNVEAGRIKTDFTEKTLGSLKHPPIGKREDPSLFAEAVYKAYLKRKRVLIWPRRYRIFLFLRALFPNFYDKKLYKAWKEVNKP
ncbi:MAG: SDR family NAD(P)-dependent oxidoreductase [Synergistetes bacterium]|nr:SDR family NAD(P)-dependent oxidoreductase [Synergistota bacterium]MCX8127560.1 SDR family NAD(P)-dependent oxidoreductase [Synergistota bacterium]MDW8191523.1 SDR family NAD(P)-dependent oxidoreductase [Synergistota bacterium]